MKRKSPNRIRIFVICSVIGILFTFILFEGISIAIVDGISMYPTLKNHDLLILRKNYYSPEQGDVVVIQVPSRTSPDEYIVKRIIAVGEQAVTIDYCNNLIFVENQRINEPYINYECADVMVNSNETQRTEYHVPKNSIFVLGDNRNYSVDSRSDDYGMLKSELIMGKVVLRISLSDLKIAAVQ